jgi:uncharacterized OB-fold protein
VVFRPPTAAYAADVPYSLALIDLVEGVRILSNVIAPDPDALTIGQRVAVFFDDVTAGFTLPRFRPTI